MFSLQLEKHWNWQRKWGIEDLPREIFLTMFFVWDSDLEMWTQKQVFLFSVSCSDFCLFGILLKIHLYSLYLICLTHFFFLFVQKYFKTQCVYCWYTWANNSGLGDLKCRCLPQQKNQSEKQTHHIYFKICYVMFV